MTLTKTISISITEGRVIRDLLYNGFNDMLNEAGYKILIISPAASVSYFIEKWAKPGVTFARLIPHKLTSREHTILKLRNQIKRLGSVAFQRWMALEYRFWKLDIDLAGLMREHFCCLAVLTHPLDRAEMPVYLAAKSLGVPTLGVLRSWDNLYRGLNIHPDYMAVWNPVNRQEAIDLMLYSPERVIALGGAQFDAYFAAESKWSREKLAQALNLDPNRPIITLATIGSLLHLYDENYLVDLLVKAISAGQIPGRPQLVLRLHPASKLEYFSMYQDIPDVRISYITGYIPTLGWTMTRDDVIFMANLLRHSDVVVSPGSTITIETAIFDTPTVVPIFHTYQPELGKQLYDQVLSRHFKRLIALDLVPLIREPGDLITSINHCLSDRGWYREQRAQLVKDYIYYTDGKSTQRLVDLMVNLAGQHGELL